MIINLGDNLTPDEVNDKINKLAKYIKDNDDNYNFNWLADP